MQCPNGATSCAALSYHQSVYDGLGRLKREIIQYPDATGIGGSAREFTYDGMSRKIRESMWDDFGFTTAFTHDRFGRVTEIRLPDSSLAPTLIRYRGEQRIDRVAKVATAAGEEHHVCTREEYDTFGRLIRVNEDRSSDGNGDCQNNTTAGLVTTYDYDEADRLVQVCSVTNGSSCGQERFFNYDNRGFLTSEQHPEIGPSGNGLTHYSYDPYGNLTRLETDGVVLDTPVDPATNRQMNAIYDAGGNLTDITLGGEAYKYTYDPLNMMKHLQSSGDQARIFIYDADDERIFTFDCVFADCQTQDDQLTATLRGLDGKVLRVFQLSFGEAWEWQRDYVYRDGQLLAAVEPKADGGEARTHLHLDHLGTPRQITDETGSAVALHSYYPFGGEATDPSQDEVELKFTGHERDGNGSADVGMLDYMHARYCSPRTGRFFSVDPILGESGIPQSWNRYAYVRNNPVRYIDPQGRESAQIYLDAQIDQFLETGTDPYFHDEALQKAALFALALANPIPGDEVGVAAMLAPKAVAEAGGILARAGKFLGKIFGKTDDASKAAAETIVMRTTRAGERGVRITRPDGSVIDITPRRVKEFVPEPRAASGLRPVRFDDAIPGSKGKKRVPSKRELDLLGVHPR